MMFGENNWKKIDAPLMKDPDPYDWFDTKKYKDRLKEAKKITGQDSAIPYPAKQRLMILKWLLLLSILNLLVGPFPWTI